MENVLLKSHEKSCSSQLQVERWTIWHAFHFLLCPPQR